MKKDVFISYKRNGGSGWAEMLRLGFVVYENIPQERIFMDVHDCGSNWKERLVEEIKNANNVVVVISKDFEKQINTNQSEDVWLYELRQALHYRRNIIPFVVDGIRKEELNKAIAANYFPPDVSKVLSENTWVMYEHNSPEVSIKRIELKTEEEMCVRITFTSVECCDLRIPAIGGNNQCYKPLTEENDRSYTVLLNINTDKEVIFLAKRRDSGERISYHVFFEEYREDLGLNEAKNSVTDVYCEIKNRENYSVDIEWRNIRREQNLQDKLSFLTDLKTGKVQDLMNYLQMSQVLASLPLEKLVNSSNERY